MCDKCIQVCKAITTLTEHEGSKVTIYHANPDFDGANNRVDFVDEKGIEKHYFEDSILECLEKAVYIKGYVEELLKKPKWNERGLIR